MDTLITEKEAALQLCLTQSSLRKWRWLGRGPSFIKIGAAVRYDPGDIKRFITQNIHQARKGN